MTEPLVPRKLVWKRIEYSEWISLLSFGNVFRIKMWSNLGRTQYKLYLNEMAPREVVDAESLEAAQAAAQQHYNELVAACCEVKRCVWTYRRLIAGDVDCGAVDAFDAECGWGCSERSAKGFAYCPNCGGQRQVEGGE